MKGVMKNLISNFGYEIVKKHPVEEQARQIYERYKDFTMIPETIFIDNLKLVWDFRDVNGCVVECGVWKGGMCAGMAEIISDREFFLFDSFEGLPPPQEIDGERALAWEKRKDSIYYHNNCSAEMSYADRAMAQTGAEFHLIKGWYSASLPSAQFPNAIAILRLDSDWYESTMDCLVHLYSKVTKGGLVIIDDYHVFDGCSRAVHDFLSRNSLTVRMRSAYSGVAYFIKPD